MGLVFEIGRTKSKPKRVPRAPGSVSAKVSPLNRHLHPEAGRIRGLFLSVGRRHLFHDPLLIQR